jgi:hypothetical protein
VACDYIWLKNVGAIYQRAMNLVFHDLIGVIMEVYINDAVIKLAAHKSHFADLCLAFERMCCYRLKMNPLKCAFGVSTRKFLGFIIHDKVMRSLSRSSRCRILILITCRRTADNLLQEAITSTT